MKNRKKSFLLYFDNYPMLLALPPEQRGLLVTALYTYAERVWQDETVTIEEVMELYPQLSPQARMASRFMGANILRDTQRWLSQRQARQERRQSQPQGAGRGAAPDQREEERVRLDMERTRNLVERLKLTGEA